MLLHKTYIESSFHHLLSNLRNTKLIFFG